MSGVSNNPQGIVVPASALQQGNIAMTTVNSQVVSGRCRGLWGTLLGGEGVAPRGLQGVGGRVLYNLRKWEGCPLPRRGFQLNFLTKVFSEFIDGSHQDLIVIFWNKFGSESHEPLKDQVKLLSLPPNTSHQRLCSLDPIPIPTPHNRDLSASRIEGVSMGVPSKLKILLALTPTHPRGRGPKNWLSPQVEPYTSRLPW